jgi:hypothetical protein
VCKFTWARPRYSTQHSRLDQAQELRRYIHFADSVQTTSRLLYHRRVTVYEIVQTRSLAVLSPPAPRLDFQSSRVRHLLCGPQRIALAEDGLILQIASPRYSRLYPGIPCTFRQFLPQLTLSFKDCRWHDFKRVTTIRSGRIAHACTRQNQHLHPLPGLKE